MRAEPMPEELYFEDVEEGTEIPTLVKNPTTQQLVRFAGATSSRPVWPRTANHRWAYVSNALDRTSGRRRRGSSAA